MSKIETQVYHTRRGSTLDIPLSCSLQTLHLTTTRRGRWGNGNERNAICNLMQGSVLPRFMRDGPNTTTTTSEFIMISRSPVFRFWAGVPWTSHQIPFYTVGHKENTKMSHLMCYQMRTFLRNYGCGCVVGLSLSSKIMLPARLQKLDGEFS